MDKGVHTRGQNCTQGIETQGENNSLHSRTNLLRDEGETFSYTPTLSYPLCNPPLFGKSCTKVGKSIRDLLETKSSLRQTSCRAQFLLFLSRWGIPCSRRTKLHTRRNCIL